MKTSNNVKLAQLFLGGDGVSDKIMLERASGLKQLINKWEELTGVPTNCMFNNK